MAPTRTLTALGRRLAVLAIAASGAACASSPTPVPIRTFADPQKMALVCLHVNDADAGPAPSVTPMPLGECPPVAPNVTGSTLENHLCALVTQHQTGELGVVDLTSGAVVDESRAIAGTNLITVGASPSDVVTTPDVLIQEDNTAYPPFAFVASDAVDKPALFAVPEQELLGDSTGVDASPPLLTTILGCAMPERPQALGVMMLDEGTTATAAPYVVVALMRAQGTAPPSIALIDPTPFTTQGPAGQVFPPCTILGSSPFSSVVPSPAPATFWSDGVPYADAGDLSATDPPLGPTCTQASADGGAPSSDAGPTSDGGVATGYAAAGPGRGTLPAPSPLPASLVVRDDAPIAYVADAAVPVIHVMDLSNPAAPVEAGQLLATSVKDPTRVVSVGGMALSPSTSDFRRYLYAIDAGDGTIMVFDVTSPKPASPAQVPMRRPHPELTPPGLDTASPPDRIAFSAPVQSIAFARHDWPLVPPAPNTDQVHAYSGLLCNPNPNAFIDAGLFSPEALGGYYRADETTVIQPQGQGVEGIPFRLRGVFAFATLSNGSMVTIDVDDWDAPCRRPDPMSVDSNGTPTFKTGDLDLPEPVAGPGDLDPYHAPDSVPPGGQTGVTEEVYYPVSAPHRARSQFLLRNDPVSGNHMAFVSTAPQLFDLGSAAPVSYAVGGTVSLILPTALPPGFVDPSYIENPTDPSHNYEYLSPGLAQSDMQDAGTNAGLFFPGSAQAVPGVRLGYDDPTIQVDQNWTVTYEGVLPATSGLLTADITTDDGFQTMIFTPQGYDPGPGTSNGARYCSLGIEDWNVGQARASAALAAMTAAGLNASAYATLPSWTGDYVEIVDDLAPAGDPYWSKGVADGVTCWEGLSVDDAMSLSDDTNPNIGTIRDNACFQTFGARVNADSFFTRDFPIVQATDNALRVGRFAWNPPDPEQTTTRTIAGGNPGNAPFLQFASCCFHANAEFFKVRAGGEWITSGQTPHGGGGIGMLNQVVPDPQTGACVLQCSDPTQVLQNARAFDVPPPAAACTPGTAALPSPIDRSSILAMRNPLLSFVMWGGCGKLPQTAPNAANVTHTFSTRDQQWSFSVSGGFSPQTVALQGTSTSVPVSPQSMFYVAPFGEMAVIDGATNGQGLILIDLNTLAFAHNPYF